MRSTIWTSLLLWTALFSLFAVEARAALGGRDVYVNQGDLALLQTAVQVDDAHLAAQVPPSVQMQQQTPAPRWMKAINEVARLVVVITGAGILGALVFIIRGWPFARKEQGEKEKLSQAGILVPQTDGVEAGQEDSTEEQLPNYMSWSTYLIGIASTVMCIFCAAFFTPNLPQMALDFQCSQQQMIATIQINWVISALAALVMGPLSDRIGRKPVLCSCLFILGISSMTCAGNGNIYWFWASRAIQGLAEGGQVAVQGSFRDVYDMKERVRIGIVTGVCVAFVPVCAPSIGGLLAHATGSWRWAFFIVSIVCFTLSILGYFFMEETLSPKKRPEAWSFSQEVKKILQDRHMNVLLGFQILMSCMSRSGAGNDAFIIEVAYHKGAEYYSLLCGSFVLVGIFTSLAYFALSRFLPLHVLQVFMAIMPFICAYEFLTGYFLTDFFKYYITSKYILTVFMTPPVLVAGPLYMEQVKGGSAGTAGAICVAANNFIGTGIGWFGSHVVSTSYQEPAMMCYVNGFFLAMAIVFYWTGFGFNPPQWAYGKDPAPAVSDQRKS